MKLSARAARPNSVLLLDDRSVVVSETDETLVRGAQLGNRAAFEEIVRRTSRLLFARLFLESSSAQQTEDLVQETFLLAWRSIGQLTEPAGLRAWLLVLARSVAVDAARRRSRKKRWGRRSPIDAASEVADRDAGPALRAEESETRGRAMELLKAMPETYRLPLMLRYVSGADYETIGRQLGLSNGSLRGLLNRGLARLRRQMEDDAGPVPVESDQVWNRSEPRP